MNSEKLRDLRDGSSVNERDFQCLHCLETALARLSLGAKISFSERCLLIVILACVFVGGRLTHETCADLRASCLPSWIRLLAMAPSPTQRSRPSIPW